VVAAVAAARELPQLTLDDALELTLLVARKDPLGIRASPPVGCSATSKKILWSRSRRQGSPPLP